MVKGKDVAVALQERPACGEDEIFMDVSRIFMGFHRVLMGFNGDLMGFHGDLMDVPI